MKVNTDYVHTTSIVAKFGFLSGSDSFFNVAAHITFEILTPVWPGYNPDATENNMSLHTGSYMWHCV